ncbi:MULTISPECIES: class I SAM-dependent methyltransferase [Actinosynnema]|uniref:SAM-dependent methyltransferase n=1 Tax=Actinosynnema pretiosum TaxID=42197 RepID=A0A290Z857_9PSEU|nr:class I SAM-dependent methyltransferase [Actinosynnema pretiosum]ATE55231.1 SAM-dependent methyltransferase [Actinosynnema pretiosum]
MGTAELRPLLDEHLTALRRAAASYDGTTRHAPDVERVVGDYSAFVTDPRHHAAWDALAHADPPWFAPLVDELRASSARCAAIMEKHRALDLLDGRTARAGYFDNVESCIADEFGAFHLTADSRVLLVGSGSFPMTPLRVARLTGARVVGVDIDPEAVELGRRVVRALGDGLDITLEPTPLPELPFTAEATHVIFSSTVSVKYDLLDALHATTRPDVVVAMRYGDRLKSLFNYPTRPVDPRRWVRSGSVLRPEHIFDVALYTKA